MVFGIIMLIIIYTLIPSIVFSILTFIKAEFRRRMRRYKKAKVKNEEEQTLQQISNNSLRFCLKEHPTAKAPVILVYTLGILIMLLSMYFEKYGIMFLIMITFPFITIGVAAKKAKSYLDERKLILNRITEVKRVGLGKSLTQDVEEVIFLSYDEDLVTPNRIQFHIPSTFDKNKLTDFTEKVTEAMNGDRAWVVDNRNGEENGWNMKTGIGILYSMSPLPNIAMWDEEYLFNEDIAWSYFPLALGVQNGVRITNRKTGKDEFVLGIDLAGSQEKLANKKGLLVGPEITASPQLLIVGGTGGGKALAHGTQVEIYKKQ